MTALPILCSVCGTSMAEAMTHDIPSDNRALRGRRFRAVRCPACRTIHGIDAEPVAKNADTYSLNRQGPSYFNRAVNRRTLRFLQKRIGMRDDDLFLAYGMRNNVFLHYLNRRIRHFFAYDPYFPKYDDASFIAKRRYDVLFMENVFGQSPNPREELRRAHALLNKGGILCLSAPDADRIDLTRPEVFALELHAPYRYHLYAPETLARLASECGFNLVRLERGRAFADTRTPFVNWRFMKEFARARDNTLDALFDPFGRLGTLLRHPRLFLIGLFGGFFPLSADAIYVFKKKVDSACRICRSGNLDFIYKNTFVETDLVRCGDCGVVFLDLRDGDAERFYEKGYYPEEPLLFEKLDAWARARDLNRRLVPESRVFEVGCGHGLTLRRLDKLGHEVYGNELTNDATAYAENRLYLKIFGGHVDRVTLPRQDFDLVCLYHVFEHLPDPVGTLRRVRAMLRAGGKLVLEVPNYGSLASRVFGRKWFFLTLPKHLFHFDKRALTRLLTAHGFRVVHVKTRYLLYDVFGGAQSALNVILKTQDVLNPKEVQPTFGLKDLLAHPRMHAEWIVAQFLMLPFMIIFSLWALVAALLRVDGVVLRIYAEKADPLPPFPGLTVVDEV